MYKTERKKFSLLEVMIAMFIFATTITTVLIGYRTVMRNISLASNYALASFLCKQKLSEKMLEESIAESTNQGTFDEFKAFSWKQEVNQKNGLNFYIINTTVSFERWGDIREVKISSGRFYKNK